MHKLAATSENIEKGRNDMTFWQSTNCILCQTFGMLCKILDSQNSFLLKTDFFMDYLTSCIIISIKSLKLKSEIGPKWLASAATKLF